ncbi:MAG: hypothetical protein U0995_13400 [Erythrobacter sp.]|nr:hypothetical protein [Erythrobacter sp.]
MKKILIGIAACAASLGGLGATAALADDIFTFRDGDDCVTVSCGSGGCQVIDRFPCPKEVSEG